MEIGLKTHSNLNVIETVLNWLQQGKLVWLSSITRTWGSSPMPAGTLMAYCDSEGMVGSLSGGCIEQDLLEKMDNGMLYDQYLVSGAPFEIIYGANEEEQKRFLLPCGGQMHILIERLKPENSVIKHFSRLKEILADRRNLVRRISLTDPSLKIASKNVKVGIRRFQDYVEHGMGPDYQILLIGASEVARCVAELAMPLDFKVSVWDHRESFIRNWQVANVNVYSGSPEKLIAQKFCDKNNAIIALAHDPRVDDFALVDALVTDAFYIGAIGSKSTCLKRNQRLSKYLDEPQLLNKMHAPVGLSIGSKTPYEIAISILAEIIQKRHQLEKANAI